MRASSNRPASKILIHFVLTIMVVLSICAVRPSTSRAQEPTPTPTVAAPEPPPPTESPTPEPTATATVPVDTPTSEPTSTSAPAPTETVAPSEEPQPVETAVSTTTPAVEPTAAPEAPAVAATTYVVTILSVDRNGNPLTWNCFDVHLDAGDGSPGTLVWPNACNSGNADGSIQVSLAPASYVLVETRRPDGAAKSANRHFTVRGTRSITVTHDLLTTLVISAKDNATGLPIPAECYNLVPLVPDYPAGGSCDESDGASDGIVTYYGIDRGTFRLQSIMPPVGYLNHPDLEFAISSLAAPHEIIIGYDKAATLLIHKRNEAALPITGACFQLLANSNGVPGELVGDFCDSTLGSDDGDVEGTGFSTGDYFLREYLAPAGYLVVADQLVSLTAGHTTELTITDPTGGKVEIHAVDDHGNPIHDICPTVFVDAGGGTRGDVVTLPPCETGNSPTDGTSTLIGLPAGNFVLGQDIAQPGYFPSADIPFSIAVGETKTIEMVNVLGGKVLVTSVDSTQPGTKLPSACFGVFKDAGGGTRGDQVAAGCDWEDSLDDGDTSLNGLAEGSYVLSQTSALHRFNIAADQTFSIALGETKSLTMSNQPYGTVRIYKKTPAGAALPGSCFAGVWAPGTPAAGAWADYACDDYDGNNDGTIDLRLPNGSFDIWEYLAPTGYVVAPITPVGVNDAGIVELTITDPAPSTLILQFVNVWNEPVRQACISIEGNNDDYGYLSGQFQCDDYDGAPDGGVTFTNLTWGTWTLTGLYLDYHFPPTSVTLDPGENKTVKVVLTQDPPKIIKGPMIGGVTQTSVSLYWETDQKTIGSVEYGTSSALGQTAPSAPGDPTTTHRITITGLQASTTYTFKAKGTNPNGDVESELFTFRTASTTATGKVVVTKTKSDGTSLAGACFDVYRNAGGGALGTYIRGSCDWFEADGNNGKITITGLGRGSYVLVEFYAPARYQLAKNVLFTLSDGQTKQVTVKDYGGGGAVRVTSRVRGGSILEGSCFSIYKSRSDGTIGAYLTSMCDDFDGEDGVTTFSGLRVGEYFLAEDYGPPGYVRDPIMQFVVSNTRFGEDITFYYRLLTDTGNVVIKAIDNQDQLVPGACFALYRATSSGAFGSYVKDACDGNDGHEDGKTYFGGIRAGTYIALEYVAPKGFIAGKTATITKVSGQQASKRIRQVAGGVEVKVTTLKGSSTTKVRGACYGLYRYSNGQWRLVTDACDDFDGTNDGVTRLAGVPPGTYRLYQVATPSGYRTPAYVSVTVGGTTKSVTLRIYPR